MAEETKIYQVLRELPKDVRDNGEEILHAIACGTSQLDWDHQLRLIVDGRVIHKTNIIELVEQLLYPEREDVDIPHGFDIFVNALSNIGLDSHWVKNEYAKEKLDENERMYDTASSEESDDSNETEETDVESNNDSNSNKDSNNEQEIDEDQEMNEEQEIQTQAPINWTKFSSDSENDSEPE